MFKLFWTNKIPKDKAATFGYKSFESEKLKDVKKRLKEAKKRLETGFDLVQYLDISYEARNQVIGSLYTNVRRIELQLERYE